VYFVVFNVTNSHVSLLLDTTNDTTAKTTSAHMQAAARALVPRLIFKDTLMIGTRRRRSSTALSLAVIIPEQGAKHSPEKTIGRDT
jgi:hypothetical protein